MHYGNLLLSKIIDDNNVQALTRFGITAADLPTEGDRQTLRFIESYAEANRGQAPSYAVVTAECPAFEYTPMISDSYELLTKQIKAYSAKQRLAEYVQGKFTAEFDSEADGNKILESLISEAEKIKMDTNVRSEIGRTLEDIKTSFKSEYLKREEGKSFKCWQTPFESLTKEIGGWFSGDVYGIMAESGRGKTYVNVKIADSLLRQGANVLVKSFEVKEYVWISRLISTATAVDELLVDELGRKLGLPNKQILSGNLEDIVREQFLAVLETLDSYYPGKLYFQGKSGGELTRTLDDLERELLTGQVDAVIIDPFYGLSDVYGKNVNKTAGGSAEYAATRFEQIIGDNDVVGFYTVQATVEKKQTGEDGVRELNLPTRDQVKTSKRLLDIATNLISFDSLEKDGIAMLGIEKGRNGGEDFTLELIALFDYGVLAEFPKGEAAAAQFGF
ncbi:DnaB-like helicase C-terminal domain-containing protein [Peribacillus huizhouensis]|uniref:Replicative DNA helicase n=1 Tax=Peribacillus huizhouensis TaxID=1501239 RepID=A0ABR6CRB7_9BACI|nr:DnaB-like helicase C-terminal domain-containing protein [Peribacillus huizhouensis]MBA9027574.1 replicative DNA helicase [Peribacillus huizhouensis]